MKKFVLIFLFVSGLSALSFSSKAQTSPYKIVFQLTSGDTLAHKALMRQLGNILTVAPNTELEVVCHGPGLDMLNSAKSVVQKQVLPLSQKGVSFFACEFSMKERKVEKSQLIPGAGSVPAGILEVVSKQAAGWQYIKSGF